MSSPLQLPKNRLLRRLSAGDYARLVPALHYVELRAHQVLHHRKLPIDTCISSRPG